MSNPISTTSPTVPSIVSRSWPPAKAQRAEPGMKPIAEPTSSGSGRMLDRPSAQWEGASR